MRFNAVVVCLLGALLAGLVACGEEGTEAPTPGSIAGEVLVEGSPLPGVTVELSGAATATTTTNESGDYRFEGLEPGAYEVRVTELPAGVELADQDATVTVEAGATARADFTGSYIRTAGIDGTVTANGEAVEGATVRLSGVESRETTTNSGGSFSFDDLRAGDYTVEVSNLGSNVVLDQPQRSVTLGVGDQASLTFRGEVLIPPQVEVPYIERPGTSLRMNLDEIGGEVDVVALVDPGTETVTRVRVALRGKQVASVGFPDGLTSEEKVEVRVNTAAFDSDTGEPVFENGDAQVTAEVDTQESGTGAATGSLGITLANRDRIAGVSAAEVGDGVVTAGHRWHGNRDLTFEVVPVLYDQSRTIGAISLEATGDASANGGPSLDLGSGHGQPHKVEGPPFVFTATLGDNSGEVEDKPDGAGHTLRVSAVFNGEGVNVTSDFVPGRTQPLAGFYVDFVPPQVPSGSGISVAGTPVADGDWFSAGTFGVSGLSETGSGNLAVDFEIDSSDRSDPISGVEAIADLAEKTNSAYSARVVRISDAIGNQTPATEFPPASPSFGVDRTQLNVTEILPAQPLVLNPTDAGSDGLADNRLRFKAEDPTLPDGGPASGYGTATASASTPGISPQNLTPAISPNASGINTIDVSSLAERTWDVSVTATDNATPANQSGFTRTVTLDKTDPSVTIIDPPPNSVTSSGTITFTIEGSASDENGFFNVQVNVRNADDNTADACELNDAQFPSGTGPGEVNPAAREVTDSADGFAVDITVHEPAGSGETDLCFFIEAQDAAKDRHDNPEPNRSNTFTRTLVTWN